MAKTGGTRTTQKNSIRERMVRWANDTYQGEAFARWFGKVAGGLQLRLTVKSSDRIPWSPLRRPINEASIAIVTTGGIHLCSDQPFDLKTDASYRVIPGNANALDLCITHEHYDRRDAMRDVNLVFPLERLRELEREGIVGRVAGTHYGFGFTHAPGELVAPGRKVGLQLAQAGVDLALLVPA